MPAAWRRLAPGWEVGAAGRMGDGSRRRGSAAGCDANASERWFDIYRAHTDTPTGIEPIHKTSPSSLDFIVSVYLISNSSPRRLTPPHKLSQLINNKSIKKTTLIRRYE